MPFDSNPYQPPQSPPDDSQRPRSRDGMELASRGSRLLAALLDGTLTMIALFPAMYELGLFSRPDAFSTQMTAFLMGFLSIILLHGYLLHTRGQSIGKAIIGIQIVGVDGSRLSLAHIVFRRYLPLQLVSLIPAIGSLIPLLDAIWIFRDDSRCLHDHIAGTVVVTYQPVVAQS